MTKEQAFRKIARIDWEFVVNRRGETLLGRSVHDTVNRFFTKITGIPHPPSAILRLHDGSILHPAKDVAAVHAYFRRNTVQRLRAFRNGMVASVTAFDALARAIETTGVAALPQAQLAQLLRSYAAASRATCFLTPTAIAGTVLAEAILRALPHASPSQKQRWLLTLSFPMRENEHTKEERSLYCLFGLRRTDRARYQRSLERHCRRFGWIGARGYHWEYAWTTADIERRIVHLQRQGLRGARALRRLDAIRQERRAARATLLRRLPATSRSVLRQYSRLAQEFAYLRTWRTDCIYGAGFRARDLFREVARRAGYNPDDARYCSIVELLAMARRPNAVVLEKILQDRRRAFTTLWTRSSYTIFPGKRWTDRIRKAVLRDPGRTKVIHGQSAYPGIAAGPARVVLTNDDLQRVRSGDILVATMTFPSYVAAMERASAFVTDEGGILCHAAIISREMKKPCVIGTKIATKVLNDGDLVEVDGEKGIVRKIKGKGRI